MGSFVGWIHRKSPSILKTTAARGPAAVAGRRPVRGSAAVAGRRPHEVRRCRGTRAGTGSAAVAGPTAARGPAALPGQWRARPGVQEARPARLLAVISVLARA